MAPERHSGFFFINCSLIKRCWSMCSPGLWTSLVLLTVIRLLSQPFLPQEANTWVSKKGCGSSFVGNSLLFFPVKLETELILHFSRTLSLRIFNASFLPFLKKEISLNSYFFFFTVCRWNSCTSKLKFLQ